MGQEQSSRNIQRADNENGNLGERIKAPSDFDGPVKNRKCTDILFFFAIVTVWVCMTGIGIDAIQNGNILILTNGIDYKGRICGYDSEVADLSSVYYMMNSGSGVCVADCPTQTNKTKLYACVDDSDIPSAMTDHLKVWGGYCEWQLASYSLLNRCIFQNSSLATSLTVTITESTHYSYFEEFLGDVWTAKYYIFGIGIGGTFSLCILYLLLLQIPGVLVLMVCGSFTLVFALFVALGAGMYYQSMQWENSTTTQRSDNEILALQVFAIIMWVAALVFLAVICFIRNRIKLAIGIIKESADCLTDMPLLICFPLFKIIGFLLFIIPWAVYLFYTASLGSFSTSTTSNGLTVKNYSYDNDVEVRGWFLLFCFFWTTQFIIAIGQIIVAMAVCTWYFSRDRGSIGNEAVIGSMIKATFFHVGTAAFGSLIIAVLEFIRSFLAYLQNKLHSAGNKVADAVLWCLQSCFWVLEKCLKFVNKNAYIQTALFSHKFCSAGKEACLLIARNIARVAAVTFVGTFILVLAKIFLAIASTTATYFVLQRYLSDKLTSLMYPCAVVFVMTYLIAEMFHEVLNMVITTLLHCFVADEEMFDVEGKKMFASESLKEYLEENYQHGIEPLRTKAVVK